MYFPPNTIFVRLYLLCTKNINEINQITEKFLLFARVCLIFPNVMQTLKTHKHINIFCFHLHHTIQIYSQMYIYMRYRIWICIQIRKIFCYHIIYVRFVYDSTHKTHNSIKTKNIYRRVRGIIVEYCWSRMCREHIFFLFVRIVYGRHFCEVKIYGHGVANHATRSVRTN